MITYLSHHGILGMKWGIRRYQNKDGTLTEAGKRRLKSAGKDNKIKLTDDGKRIADENLEKGLTSLRSESATDFRNVANIGREAINITRETRNLARQHSENVKNKKIERISKMNLSEMSDEDLRQAINRMNLEKQYKSYSVETVQRGQDHVDRLLQTAGTVLAVGVSAATIAAAIEELKK